MKPNWPLLADEHGRHKGDIVTIESAIDCNEVQKHRKKAIPASKKPWVLEMKSLRPGWERQAILTAKKPWVVEMKSSKSPLGLFKNWTIMNIYATKEQATEAKCAKKKQTFVNELCGYVYRVRKVEK